MTKKISVGLLAGLLLIFVCSTTAFAAITLDLSREGGYKGDRIAISGTYDPNEWVIVRALDADGNIVYIKPVLAGDDGAYDTTFIVPDVSAGTLRITAGSGSDVVNADLTVKKKTDDKTSPKSSEATPATSAESDPALGAMTSGASGTIPSPSPDASPTPEPADETPAASSLPTATPHTAETDLERGGGFLTVLWWILGSIAAMGAVTVAVYFIWWKRK